MEKYGMIVNMDMFGIIREENAPLADRMRSQNLDDFLGQEHLISSNSLLSRAIRADRLGSCIFYGPPGTGKTTLANIIAKTTGSEYAQLNAVSSGVADAKRVIEEAKSALSLYGKRTYLILDECHRWNKAQSDSVLSAIEKGEVIFIGSTTENPFVSMTKAIISRCRVFEFKPLSITNIKKGLIRSLNDKPRGLGNLQVNIGEDCLNHIAFMANGDLRNALNALELAVLSTTPNSDGTINVTLKDVEESIQRRSMGVDEDMYYDIISAFCKSLRGSDPDAAVYYAMRLIDAGCDPLLVCRRLIVHSAEDVGLADPRALTIAVSAMQAFERIGLPEGKIPLTEAIIYVCMAPKSNSVVIAKELAEEKAALAEDSTIPAYLKDNNYKQEKDKSYKNPHDYGGWVDQQYLPDNLKDVRFYFPSQNGEEKGLTIKKLK